MTDEARTAIKILIERHTAANTQTQKAARDSIVRKGIYTANGRLTPEYGGPEPRAKPAPR